MDANEREIFNFLQTWGSNFVSAKEVCRRASTKKRYNDEPDWARPILQIMVERGTLERDAMGRYRIKPEPKKAHGARWVSPAIAEMLKEGGLEIEADAAPTAPEDHGQA